MTNLSDETVLRSGDFCKCGHCGFEGFCYGAPTSNGVTSPWCTQCGINNKLEKSKAELEGVK